MTPFNLQTATSAENAVALLAANPGAALLAGGTTQLPLMKLGVARPGTLIDIGRIGHDAIERDGDGWRVGALARNADVARHPELAAELPMLTQAILMGASGQVRAMATVGGNLLQRTHCPYFRDVHAACNKRTPGSGCDAIGGQHRAQAVLGTSRQCIATHPGDMAVALAALDASVVLLGPRGWRTVAFTGFNLEPGDTPERETTLADDEIILAIHVPAPAVAGRSLYRKVRDRASYAYALVSCAVALDLERGVVRDVRIALGGVATRPWRAWQAEAALRGQVAGPDAFRRAAGLALVGAVPGRQNGFKVAMAEQVLVQSLAELAETAP